MQFRQFQQAFFNDPHVANAVREWLKDHPPPAEWKATALEWAWTEMPVLPFSELWCRLRAG
jgi:hypothetical protein